MKLATAVAKGCAVPLTACLATLGAAAVAVAQDTFPSKSVKLIVPYPPGGALSRAGAPRAAGPDSSIDQGRSACPACMAEARMRASR
jgi:hypothetical protein